MHRLLEALSVEWKIMTVISQATLRERVQRIETMPAIPAVFLPLMKLISQSEEEVRVDEVVRLISYDGTIAAQCLRLANSPLFGLPSPPHSIKSAVMTLGLRRVSTILLTCSLGQAFPAQLQMPDPAAFWRHSLGCALVCRRLSEKLGATDHEKAYMAGLLHDVGYMVNHLAFPSEFAPVLEQVARDGVHLEVAELELMGFTHCDTGRILAEKWKLPPDIIDVIAHHHSVEKSEKARLLVALVHLSDLLCRMRDLGHGYYECHKVDWIADPAWSMLASEHRSLQTVDLARFSFELDESVEEIRELVATLFGFSPAIARA
jgi:putative nucleotidyltransferase with HDIG domain